MRKLLERVALVMAWLAQLLVAVQPLVALAVQMVQMVRPELVVLLVVGVVFLPTAQPAVLLLAGVALLPTAVLVVVQLVVVRCPSQAHHRCPPQSW